MSETEITSTEARDIHGVICKHGRMSNGELRFRLIKNDGTAYIRTESSPSGGWQNSHYHNKVKETYIVQKGWIGYAELLDDEVPQFHIYHKGESFTTKPYIIHNIYMPAESVIHTIKHGDAAGESRLTNERADWFTKKTKNISEDELKRRSSTTSPVEPSEELGDYSEAYRHFDNLIWQVSAWSSAVFAVVLGGTARIDANSPIMTTTGLSIQTVMALLYALFGVFIFVLSYALYRFRWHQIRVKKYTATKFSPQVGLQMMVNAQAIVLLLVPLLHKRLLYSFVLGAVVLIGLTIIEERSLYQAGRVGDKPRRTLS